MTSTEYTVGLGGEDRTSSKILKPPGGGSSDIFGTSSAKENSALAAEYKSKNSENAAIGDGESNNPSVLGENDKSLGNPITGEGYKAEDIETEKVMRHPAVRVRNPPGGPSTKLW